MITFQYRLFPSKSQQIKLWYHANKLNFLYNYFLNQRIENYKNGIKIHQKEQQAELISLKSSDPILKEIHSQVLQQVPLRLDNSYKDFFRRVKAGEVAGFPKFRRCENFFGICYPQSGYKIENNYLITKAYGKIPFIQHRDIKGEIKQVSISHKDNKFYLNIVTDYIQDNSGIGKIGIDLGLKTLVVTTDGNKIPNKPDAKYFDKQISKLQSQKDSLKMKGSQKYKFLKKVINRLYDAKVRKVNDYQHKVSRRLGSTYDTIYAEDLSVKTMSESKWKNLNKSIRNAKLAQFLSFLSYKTNNLLLVNPKNTSKTCNKCGKIHDITLADRTISCSCGNIYDRDENAAKNIYCLGQAIEANPQYVGCMTIQEALTFR
jgi:putative transposase